MLSAFPASASSQQSGIITGLLTPLFGDDLTIRDMIEKIVRKTAHVLEFTALGGLWCGYFYLLPQCRIKPTIFAFLVSVGYAVSDEIHQYFVPGRAARLYDVGFDTIGIVVGILSATLIFHQIKRRNQ